MKKENESLYSECRLCPRNCGKNRLSGELGYCSMTAELKVARAALHMWEEPVISGSEGSGTVFFSGCSLRCIYCQNHNIAKGSAGKTISVERLAEIFLELQAKKANNINLVTGTHYVPHITEALDIAKANGLSIPVLYNTSGYEKAENIKRLDGYIDIYLPDFKYADRDEAKKYSNAPDYMDFAAEAIDEMVHQTGKPEFDDRGIMQKGVIIRHLVIPGNIKNSKKALDFIHDRWGNDVFVSIMKQYTPMPQVNNLPDNYRELKRKLTDGEYNTVVSHAVDIGIRNGFTQTGESASESFIPEFDNEGV